VEHACSDALEDALTQVGAAALWGRDAARIPIVEGSGNVPWTPSLHAFEVVHLTEIARTACMLVIATVTGMRAGELMELTTAAPLPPSETAPGLARYKLAGRVIKDQPHGGTPDEWVVIAEVHRAARLAASLLSRRGDDKPGQDDGQEPLLFGRFSFDSRYRAFRDWVNSPAGQRLGLAPIPGAPPTPRALRRTLAIELAYRPGGLLAAKLRLKHISVATTEGYASRPLAGVCDSARCPQATHHPCHRDVWADHAASTTAFLGALGPARRAEKTRLQHEHARSLRVLQQIDSAATTKD
jgi:hypothetical protein